MGTLLATPMVAQAEEITSTGFDVINVFFGIIAVVSIVAALKMVSTSNVVHAALYLLVVLSSVAGIYVLLGAEFAAATQVLVYLGAIMVLMLFGVMLTRAKIGKETDLDHENRWIGALVGISMFSVMAYSLIEQFGTEKFPEDRYEPINTDAVANEIFSTYIVPFEALSVLLLAALIGAVVVARKD